MRERRERVWLVMMEGFCRVALLRGDWSTLPTDLTGGAKARQRFALARRTREERRTEAEEKPREG